MPSLFTARRIANTVNNGAKTIGQIHKENADFAMEQTWNYDYQSKICYIYDYFHDDQPRLKDHMTYRNTTKTRIDAKFIVKSKQSIDKDQVEFYLQFKPSQKLEFMQGDDLYYFETDYRGKFDMEFPIGLYVDVPDEKNVYHKWLICEEEISNQFTKYLVLPCKFEMMWIEKNGQDRIKRRMWSVLRSQNSYNSGLWTDYRFTAQENQDKIWLPLNSISEKIWYTNDEETTMRLIVSAKTEHPIVWKVSKVENLQPIGIQKLTLYQTFFDQNRDYIERDVSGKIIGMWADYNFTSIPPTESTEKELNVVNISAKINTATQIVKIGGSYKTLSVQLIDKDGKDITSNYSSATYTWFCDIDGIEMNDNVKWLDTSEPNKIKLKFIGDRSYLGKILHVGCTIVNNADKKTCIGEANYELTI